MANRRASWIFAAALSAAAAGACSGDDNAVGDEVPSPTTSSTTAAAATASENDVPLNGRLASADDSAVTQVELDVGEALRARLEPDGIAATMLLLRPGSPPPVSVEVDPNIGHNPGGHDGAVVASTDRPCHDPGAWPTADGWLVFVAPEAGTYQLVVTAAEWASDDVSAVGDFTVVHEIAPAPVPAKDDFDNTAGPAASELLDTVTYHKPFLDDESFWAPGSYPDSCAPSDFVADDGTVAVQMLKGAAEAEIGPFSLRDDGCPGWTDDCTVGLG